MSHVTAFEGGRRLCLLAEAGGARYALEATGLIEVAQVPPDATTLRGQLPLEPLVGLLGGAGGEAGTVAVVLDVSPTLTLRLDRALGVVDVGRAPFFLLPPWLGAGLVGMIRGALVHEGALHLELSPEGLRAPPGPPRAPELPVRYLSAPPERALLFRSGGTLHGLSLAWVGQVVRQQPELYCPLPVQEGPVLGLYAHAQALWPVCSVGRLRGEAGPMEAHLIFAEPAGQGVAICAEAVLGVVEGLVPDDAPGSFIAPGMAEPALFLDLPRMFS